MKFLFCVSNPLIFLAPFLKYVRKRDSKCGIFHLVDLLIRKNYFYETIYQKHINRRNFSIASKSLKWEICKVSILLGSGFNRGQCHVEYKVELQSVRPSVCLCPSVYPYVRLCVHPYEHLYIHPYVCPSVCPYVCPYIHLYVSPWTTSSWSESGSGCSEAGSGCSEAGSGWLRLLGGWFRLAPMVI